MPSKFIGNIANDLSAAGLNKDSISNIVIPEGCVGIEGTAFQNMDGLEEVSIASTVRAIGNVAFGDGENTMGSAGCDKLKKVIINTNSDGKSELQTIGSRAFRGCGSLKEITNLNNTSLKSIANGAFDAVAVEDFYLPDSWALNNASVSSIQDLFRNNKSLKSVNMPALFYIQTSSNSRANLFTNCPDLETVTFRTVEGATVKSYDTSTLPDNIFNGDSGLKVLDISAWEKVTSATTFTLKSTHFAGATLDDLEKIRFPGNKAVTIDTNTFKDKHFSSISGWENVDAITTIGKDAFNSSRITAADMSGWTKLTSIGETAFRNCESMTALVIPENVTSIGTAAFKNCDNLATVRIEAKSLTSVSETNLFHGDDNLESVTISDKTKKINGNVLASIPAAADTFFEGENVIEITKATKKGGSKPLKDLNGTYYVDPQGVLYKLSEDGKASLAYVPPGITSYTVPEKFTTPGEGGTEYTVTAMEANALYHADKLTAIDFTAPQNVYLKSSAFSGWSTSTDNKGKTVQGKGAIDMDQWAKVSKLCDYPIDELEGELVKVLNDTYINSDGKEVLSVKVAVQDKNPSEDKTYDYLTGQKATYAIAITNDDNIALNDVIRIYFAYSDDGYKMGSFPEGEYKIKNPSNGNIYPMKVVQTDNPNIYYYEITGRYTLSFS
ncbi:MAG: leucine-rich repeat domain-containing protein [Eubacterium sp.]|nr:leucine-rich repeat domain-containing protein [Eubacterium sp.]